MEYRWMRLGVSREISSSSLLISDSDVPWVLQSSEQGLGLMDQN